MLNAKYYAPDYAAARETFRSAAASAGADVASFRNDQCAGPAGEDLYTDVAWIGERDPDAVLMLVSGTHGIEGFCGSACQAGFLLESLPGQALRGTALLLVHALNPYGFAHRRRVNEDNVDLNRNFVDHANPPHNPAYDELHDALVPSSWLSHVRAEADALIARIGAERGLRYLQEAVTRGQYRHPDGLFYGGTEPVWSHRMLRSIVREYLPGCPRVGYIDLHTGLGPRGHGEPIFRGGWDSGAVDRAREWYGSELTLSEDGSSSSTPIIGNTASLVGRELSPGTEFTAITLEFGTIAGLRVLDALRADNWLRVHPDCAPELAEEIASQMREAFSPSDCAWRGACWARAKQVFSQAIAGLGAMRVELSA